MEETFAFKPPAIVVRLTGDELAALRRFAEIGGRRWKSILLKARERSNYAGTGLADTDRPLVQSAINKLGPTDFLKLRMRTIDSERKLLSDALGRMNGKSFRGRRCMITVPQDGQRLYLSGTPYLFSTFAERAYELGTDQAEKLIERCPVLLGKAEILIHK
jgi:hypothetical protein